MLENLNEDQIQNVLNSVLDAFSESAILLFYQGEIYFKSKKDVKNDAVYDKYLDLV